MKLKSFFTLLLAFFVHVSFAQQKTVTGSVSDESGPLPGVTVIVKGTNNGTQTDFDGNYSIKAKAGDVLLFSFIGMESKEVKVGGTNTYNVTMTSSATALDEVVVTALGLNKKKDEDLSSSTSVNTEALQKSGESGLIQGLAGKTSGLKITRNSGDPGAGAYIQIRGQNTINGDSSPLIILDGVPISNSNIGGGTAGVTQQSRLNDISSDDIENVTVLKGAAAAAVWGTGAANGVIVITSKQGRAQSKVQVNVKSAVSVDRINIEFEKQDKFGQGYPDWWYGSSDYSYTAARWVPNVFASWGDYIGDRSGGADDLNVGNTRFESASGNVIYPINQKNSREIFNKSNRDQVFGDGITYDNSVNVNFSGQNSSSYLSYSDWNQDGIIRGQSSYRRQTIRFNQTTKLNDDWTIKFNTSYAKIASERIQTGSNLNGLYLGYLRTPPDFDNSDYIGTFYNSNNIPTPNSHRGFRNYLGSSAPIYNNPGWTINEQGNPNMVNRFTVTPQITWDFAENMTLNARYGLDYYTDHRETFFPVNSAGGVATGSYSQSDIQEKTSNFNVFVNANHELSDVVNMSWILGATLDENNYSSIAGTSTQFTNPDVGDLRIFGNATAENESVGNFKQKTRKSGGYAVVNFDFFDQLYLEMTGRLERPSTLEKTIFYPSASLGWQFSKQLNTDDSWFNFGKVRFSYGEIGIEPGAYATSTTYGPGGIGSSWGDALSASAYGNPFTRSVTLGNPNLKEERVKEFEIGTDMRMFDNLVNLGFTYYDRKTEDAILFIDVPATTGFSSTPSNAATITNKGWELDLGVKLWQQREFNMGINMNLSSNKNEVVDMSGVQSVFLAGFTGTSSRAVEGEAMGTLWGGRFDKNTDGSYILDANGFPEIAADEGILGDPNPDWIGGLGLNMSYKRFGLSAFFETSQGNDHWTGTEGVLKFFGIHKETANISSSNQDLKTFDGRTIAAGTEFRGNVGNFGGSDVALTEEWYLANGGGFGSQSETFVQDASWTRLREVALSYSFDPSNLGPLTNLDVSVSGRNLFLWTDIEGFDPDMNLTGASKGRGLDYFTNPATQSWLFTVKFGF